MDRTDIRLKALDHAVDHALNCGTPPPPLADIVVAAKTFEAYLAGTETDAPCPTCQGGSRETVGMVCQTCEEANRLRQVGGDARRRILDATSRLQSAIMRPGVTHAELSDIAGESASELISVVNLLGGAS